MEVYGLNKGPNFQDPHHPEDGRKNVLYLIEKPSRQAAVMHYSQDQFNERLERINAALLAVRNTRDQPGTDDKILAGWNGLMIAGMADGGRVLQETTYVDAAGRAADFVLETMGDGNDGLLRAYRQGTAKVSGVLEDYAFMIRGLMALYRATGQPRWLAEAERLNEAARQRFWDNRFGGYFDTLADSADLFVRNKSTYDGAVPCGNSVMLNNLIDLYESTGDTQYLDAAAAALRGNSNSIAENPVGAAISTLALSRFLESYPQRLAEAAPPATGATTDTVTIRTSAQTLSVAPGSPATLEITLQIADGYHINANDPGLPSLIPLIVQLTSGQGLRLQPAYPAGELYQDEIRVHHGTLRLPVTIHQVGPVSGTPRLQLVYQVCTDKVCLVPSTIELEVQIDVADVPSP